MVKLPAGSTDAVTAGLKSCGTFAIQIADPAKVVTASEEVTLTTEWQEIKVVFDATADDKFFGLVLNTPAAIDVDAISIQKAVKAPQYVADGNEMVTDGNAPATAGDTVHLGGQKLQVT